MLTSSLLHRLDIHFWVNIEVVQLIDYVGEHGVELSKQTVGIVHGDDEETVNKIKEMLREKYGATLTIDNYVGCAIGAHTGPGIVGIVFLDAHSPYITKET